MEAKVEVTLKCSGCNGELSATQRWNGEIEIDVCDNCVELERKKGYEEGVYESSN